MSSPRFGPPGAILVACAVLLFCLAAAAGPIEALPVREWTSRNGNHLQARLAYLTERTRDSSAFLQLVPADLTRPPIAIRYDDLSAADQRYVETVWSPYLGRSGWRDLTKAELLYADGALVPGKLVWVNTRNHLLGFRKRQSEDPFTIGLDALSPESFAQIDTAYVISPRLETSLAQLHPIAVSPASTPARHLVKNVPLIRQDGSYCVPASATMIATHHGLKITQKQLAHLSSDASRQHKGTWSGDMANAMESLGFLTETRIWADQGEKTDFARFEREILPFIRAALLRDGPLYVSFKKGVYGDSGHGCIVVGYNDHGKGELSIHNPWGRREEYSYRDFSRRASEVVRFYLPPPSRGDAAALEAAVGSALHRMPIDLTDAMNLLRAAGLKPRLRLHGRHDRRDDRFEIERWALAQGFRVLTSTLRHNAVCLIPATRDDRIAGWFLVRHEGDSARPLVRPRGPHGWGEAARPPLDLIFKTWSTPVNVLNEPAWDMPLIELDE